jgi:hypothetical protein
VGRFEAGLGGQYARKFLKSERRDVESRQQLRATEYELRIDFPDYAAGELKRASNIQGNRHHAPQ